MKKCGVCLNIKPLSDFNKKGTGYQHKCRLCQKQWYANYYHESDREKKRLYDRNIRIRKEIADYVRKAKNVACMDCGIRYPYFVMDFDHRDPSKKEFTIASSLSLKSFQQIKDEISKCDVVCSNCHRIRTWSKVDNEEQLV